ncbi:hypothetical protein, partial [Pseudonocardia zijingensis]|uniref:hypothetical protein n=1 Tax=Pseudonocardia zijingensis TaxID=153376 RepID=UPI0031E27142
MTVEPPARPNRPRTSATITVAELVARQAGAPVPPPRPTAPAGAISVAALMRREGRGPHEGG